MLITATGLGWQTVPLQNRDEQSSPQAAAFQAVAATAKTDAQANSQGSTSQQNAEDNRKEAFAKLLVMLQNPDTAARHQAGVGKQQGTDALQEFRDYMAKSPEEKIKEKILQEIGLTQDEYEALPPEQKAKIDQQITQRMQEDVQMKTQAKLEEQAQRTRNMALGNEEREKSKTVEV